MSATFSITLDMRRVKQSGKFPVKLRVTFQRISEYYVTVFDITKNDWEKLPSPRINSELQSLKNKLKQIEKETSAFIENLEPFSFQEFEKQFIQFNSSFKIRNKKFDSIPGKKDDFDYKPFEKRFRILKEDPVSPGYISYSYLIFVKKLLREGRISTAVSYHCSYISLKKFKGDVTFQTITSSYLLEYENWLRNQNISKATIGIYLRPLRAVFNEAIESGLIKKEKCYPFGKRKYRIPTSRNVKKALTLDEVKRIYFYQCNPEQSGEQLAKDYWLFSYFGNGMNPKDIANLKYKNIDGDYLIFERSKTENSLRSDPKPITVFLNDDMKDILERRGNKNKAQNNYVFPVLEHGLTPFRQYELIQNFVKLINDWMKCILQNLGINKKGTTYVARHTFSTVLKRSGASTEFIQEALGHTDIKTTENYLDSFEKETKKEFAHKLFAFKKTSATEDGFIN